jgi:two-component system CheB/CheR fusion protein
VGLGLAAALGAPAEEVPDEPLGVLPAEAREVEAVTAGGATTLALTVRPLPDAGGWIATLRTPEAADAREITHRLKNLLSTVQALATQGSSKGTAREFLPLFLDRLQALAQTYDLLARRGWLQAELVDLARAVLARQPGGADRIELRLADRSLRPKVVQTLGLTLQELAANARRFGALSRPEGKVRLTSEDDGTGDIRLLWQEHGGPTVSPSGHKGFGLRALNRMLEQHAGRCEFDWHSDGLVCRIAIPAAEADPL